MKLYLKTYFHLCAFICQEIRKNSGFQDCSGCICNLYICVFLAYDADSVADGQQAAPEVRQWFNTQTWALTESVGAFPNAFFSSLFLSRAAARNNKTVLVLLGVHSSKLGRDKKILKWFISREEISKRKKVRISLSLPTANSQSNMVFVNLEEICLNLE